MKFVSLFFRAKATSKSGKPIENTTTYLPLGPRGRFIEKWDPENLLKTLAPVWKVDHKYVHYENMNTSLAWEDLETEKTENVDIELLQKRENSVQYKKMEEAENVHCLKDPVN